MQFLRHLICLNDACENKSSQIYAQIKYKQKFTEFAIFLHTKLERK